MHVANLVWLLLKLYGAVIVLLIGIAAALAISKAIAALRQKSTTASQPIESVCSRSVSS